MEDDLNFLKMEDDLNFFGYGRQPYVICQQKTQKNYKKIMQPETLKIKSMVVAPLRVTYGVLSIPFKVIDIFPWDYY